MEPSESHAARPASHRCGPPYPRSGGWSSRYPTIRPSRMRTVRCAKAAASGLCVIIRMVWPVHPTEARPDLQDHHGLPLLHTEVGKRYPMDRREFLQSIALTTAVAQALPAEAADAPEQSTPPDTAGHTQIGRASGRA